MSRYDVEKFDPAPDPDLVCCICQCVLDKAVECPCRHVFCQLCIERWLTNRHTCPTCRKRTTKQDLQPVLPLLQNVLNRLLMICDYHDNGCLDKIMLENYDNHVKDCGYEMKTCRFIKCGQKILKMHIEQHESVDCAHRESLCGGECGLMIALSDRPTHVCMDALKCHIDEKNRMIDTLKSKLHELNNLSQSLNDQLEQLRQQLDNNNRDIDDSYSDTDMELTDLSDQDSIFEDSNDSFTYQLNGNNSSVSAADGTIQNDDNDNNNDMVDNNDPANDVFEQVEVTVVNSLFDLSSRLTRVRDEMRSVLNTGTVPDNSLTEDLGMRSARFDDIIDNMSRNISDTSARSDVAGNRINLTSSSERTDSANDSVDDANNSHQNISVSDDDDNDADDESHIGDDTHNTTPIDYEPRSDHSYSSYREIWRTNKNSFTSTSPVPNHRSPHHSYRSDYDRQSMSDHSYSATPSRRSVTSSRSIRSRSPTPFSYSNDRSRSRSRSRSGSRNRSMSCDSEDHSVRSPFSRSESRSPSHNSSSITSPDGSPTYHSTPRSSHSVDGSVLSDRSYRSNSGSYRSDVTMTPRNSDGTPSSASQSPASPAGTRSPGTPASQYRWSENYDSDDNQDSEGSRHVRRDWSYRSQPSRDGEGSRHSRDAWSDRSHRSPAWSDRLQRSRAWTDQSHSPGWSDVSLQSPDRSRSLVSHRDEVSDDDRRSTADSHVTDRSADSHMTDRSADSHVRLTDVSSRNDRSEDSDLNNSREQSPDRTPSHYDTENDRGSRTPTSVHSIGDSGADSPTPSNHSDSKEQINISSSAEEDSLRQPLKCPYKESTRRQTPSPSLAELHFWGEDDLSYINNLPSDELPSDSGSDRSPPRHRAKKKRKRFGNRRHGSPATSRRSVKQTNGGKNENKTITEQSGAMKAMGGGKSEGETGVKDNGRKIGGQSQRAGRGKTETYTSATPDSGINTATPDTEPDVVDNVSKGAERKRKVNVERETSAVLDGVRRSKRNKPATVGLVTQAPIPGPSTIIKTSLPQATSTSSNVNLKIDLSLFNISGQLFPSAKAMAVGTSNNSTVTQTSTSQSSTSKIVKSLRSLPKRGLKNLQSTSASNSKPEPTQTSKTKTQTSTNSQEPVIKSTPVAKSTPIAKSTTQSSEKTQHRSKRRREVTSQRSNTTSSSTRDFPNSWCDDSGSDSDSDSDKTWSPGPDNKSETDVSLTEEEEILSDSSYEVLVPKTAADLLNEYKSDDTDDSWDIGDEC